MYLLLLMISPEIPTVMFSLNLPHSKIHSCQCPNTGNSSNTQSSIMFCLFLLPSEAFTLSHLNSSWISNCSNISDSSILIFRTSTESHLLNHHLIRLLSGQNLYWTTICLLNKVQIISLAKYLIDSIVFWPLA